MLAALWALLLAAFFLSHRGGDVGQFPGLAWFFLGRFSGFNGVALRDSCLGILVTAGVVASWYGIGSLAQQALPRREPAPSSSWAWRVAVVCAWGAGATSLLWFLLGLLHLYSRPVGAGVLAVGLPLFVRAARQTGATDGAERWTGAARALLALTLFPLLLAVIAALAPPTAKDALLYHIALPKAFLAGHGLINVPGNIAQYYALGAEMNGVWGMLLGRIVDLRSGEAAFGGIAFAYLPLLVLAIYGWLRQRGHSRVEALTPIALIVCIPTIYTSASSGYNDMALMLYLTLAVLFAAQWWQSLTASDAAQLGLALGCALQVKLLAVFMIVPILVLILFRLREAENAASLPALPARQAENAKAPHNNGNWGGSAGLQPGEYSAPVKGALAPAAVPGAKAHHVFLSFVAGLKPGASTPDKASRRIAQTALFALALAAIVAAPWYVRNWVRTGSPVYPFYMNLFGGHAPGWDQSRSVMDQMLNARYGGYPKNAFDYLAVPVRASLAAQPELPRAFDGVLGISFLFGLPLLFLAIRRRQLATTDKIAGALAGGFFLFWLFSSEQLRYLLPALPALALALSAAASTLGRRVRTLLAATAALGLVVIAAWFCRQAPLPVVIGAEPRAAYLERMVDHYSIYAAANRILPADARVWLINVRGDTYYFERAYDYDFRIEDYTLVSLVRTSASLEELQTRVRQAGITHVLARTDVLLDYAVTPVVDETRSAEENDRKFQMLRSFLNEGEILRQDERFALSKIPESISR